MESKKAERSLLEETRANPDYRPIGLFVKFFESISFIDRSGELCIQLAPNHGEELLHLLLNRLTLNWILNGFHTWLKAIDKNRTTLAPLFREITKNYID